MKKHERNRPDQEGWRTTIFDIIFGHQSRAGWAFDVGLLIAILLSVFVVCIETIPQFDGHPGFFAAEVVFTAIFTIEFLLRIACVKSAWRYLFSFFGIVDMLAVVPSLVAIVLVVFFDVNGVEGAAGGAGSYAVIRALRLLRVFRILKLGWLMKEGNELSSAIWRARAKIVVFVGTVVITVVIAGALMYEIENRSGANDKFSSIPESIYWAIVTMTTVGYGDITPTTPGGKFVTAILILLGYSLIIVPTGFVSAEVISQKTNLINNDKICPDCRYRGHDVDAIYCKICGNELN